MNMYKFIKYSVFTFTALFLLSCNNDELEKKQENAKVARTTLELAKFSNLNIAQNVEADFENVNEIEKDNFKISEFSAKEKVVNTFKSNVLQSQLKYQGVTIENEGKSQSYFLEVYTLAKSAAYPQTITKLKDFTGGLNVYSFNGENLGSVVVRSGKAANASGKNELDILTKVINLFYAPSDITSKIPLCDATYTQTVWLTQDVWRIISNGPKILEVIYEGERVTKSINILPYPCDGPADIEAIKLQRMAHYYRYSDGGQYLGESSAFQIMDYLTGKAKCLNDLLNKNGNSFVQNLFSKFEGESKFDIAISSADVLMVTKDGVTKEVNGKTFKPDGKLIKIEISTSRVNARAPLEVARIILHEYIHADIYRKLGTVLAMNVENLDFKTTYEKYEGEQHSVMATLYVQSMKEALKQFHQSILPGDIKAYTDYYNEPPSDAFYEALAWGGLRDEDVKAWNELSATKKASIEALASRVERFSKTSPCSN
ncbi:hypothetical protein [Flavobacterium sp. MMS24-S5]|uniref:hypothetical protein n=1 Tax=Flavobacterium sp. MMS24-S5 TaxID=3416605 RepID=UPI003D057BB6